MRYSMQFQKTRKSACIIVGLFLVLSSISYTRAAGKDDLQVTITLEKAVSQGESGTFTITYTNVGKYKLAAINSRVSSPVLEIIVKEYDFELAEGGSKVVSVAYKVKSDKLGRSLLYVSNIFCTEIPQAFPPCPYYTKDIQYEFEVKENVPPTSSPTLTPEKLEISIASPTPDSVFTTEQAILFEASVTQTHAQIYYIWESDIDGLLGQERKFSKSLSEGSHTITLTAKMGAQTKEAIVRISVGKGAVEQTTPPPQSPEPEVKGGSNLTPFIIFSSIIALLALIAIGVIYLLPKKKKRKRKIGRHAPLNICPSCGRNNSSTATHCWKCKALLR
jgi:hypothetical protein